MKRILWAGVMALALVVVVPLSASAAMISGSFSKSGTFVPVDGGTNNLDSATALDFVPLVNPSGDATPGVAGEFLVNTATLDFANIAGFVGATGSINDFSFSGAGMAGYPAPPLLLEFDLPGGVTFTLNSVMVALQDASFLNLQGEGFFTATGFDQTPGSFFFTGQTAGGGTFSFSASQESAPTQVPEPGSLLLFATGLFGLAAAARRRLAR